jgi:hypothetical protein
MQEGVLERTCCYEGQRIVSIVAGDRFEQGVS